jgi:hypothetical protein
MAKRRKKRKGTLRAAGSRPAIRKGGKRRKKRKGFMGEIVSHQGLKKAGKSAGAGFLGGATLAIAESFLPDNELVKIGTAAVLALGAGAGMDMPNVAAGIGGAYGYGATMRGKQALLGEMEDAEYADNESLEEYPDAMDEDGNPLYLADDGELYYMDEIELQDDAGNRVPLAETFQDRYMYPKYVNSSGF